MIYNVKKTVCMAIKSTMHKHIHVPDVILNDKCLSWVEEHKYLGVFISFNMSDNRDIQRQTRSTYARGNMLINKFRHCSSDVKLQLFKSYCTSLYCCALWSNYSTNVYSKVKVAYNNIFRSLMKVDRFASVSHAFLQMNLDSFSVLVRSNIFSLRKRLLGSDNCIIDCIMSSTHFLLRRSINKKWTSKLY